MLQLCPVCNGMKQWSNRCHQCDSPLNDDGRYQDQFGPYSPYMPMDAMKWTDGLQDDASQHRCMHISSCSQCGTACLISVAALSALHSSKRLGVDSES